MIGIIKLRSLTAVHISTRVTQYSIYKCNSEVFFHLKAHDNYHSLSIKMVPASDESTATAPEMLVNSTSEMNAA
jgi:hypothetical protein